MIKVTAPEARRYRFAKSDHSHRLCRLNICGATPMSWLSPLRRWSAPASLKPGTFRPRVEQLEQRTLPASTITAAFGAGPGGGPVVTVVFDDNSRFSFLAFPPNFNGGVSAILGRVNGTAVPDVIVGTGRGLPEVEVFNGQQLLAGNVVP